MFHVKQTTFITLLLTIRYYYLFHVKQNQQNKYQLFHVKQIKDLCWDLLTENPVYNRYH